MEILRSHNLCRSKIRLVVFQVNTSCTGKCSEKYSSSSLFWICRSLHISFISSFYYSLLFFFFWPLAHVLELDLIWLICLFWAGEFMHQGNAVLFCVIFLYWALGSPVLRNLRLWCASLWFQAVVLNQRRDLRGYLTPRVPWEQYSGIWLV